MSWCGFVCDAGEAVVDTVVDTGGDVVDAAVDAAEEAVETVIDFAEDAADFLSDTAGDVADTVSDVASDAWDWITETGDELVDYIKETAGDIWEATKGYAEEAWDWLEDKASDVWSQIEDAAETVWDFISDIASDIADFIEEKVVPFLIKALWVVTHLDDIILGFGLGLLCLILGKDEQDYDLIGSLVDLDGDVLQYVKHRLLPVNGKYVVFSDHHLFVEGDPLDRFRQIGNHELYMAVLHYYAQNGYTLIENGDVEDLWMRPMSFSSAAEDIALEVIGWPIGTAIEEAREETRITNQARDIFTNNADVYFTIDSRFHSNGRFVRIWGNHDDYWSQSKYVDELQAVYTNLQPVEYAIITDSSGPAEVLIAHGHQIDAWNNATCRVAGELITESVSGIPSLAASVEEREDWESKLSDGFDNELSNIDLPGSSISENEFYEKTKEEFSDRRDMPEFVLGHSHTPREDALIENWQYEDEWTFDEYTNEGTAGRWEEFVWCADIVNGQVGLKGFYINGNNQIVMQSFRGAGSATGILERVGNAQIIA